MSSLLAVRSAGFFKPQFNKPNFKAWGQKIHNGLTNATHLAAAVVDDASGLQKLVNLTANSLIAEGHRVHGNENHFGKAIRPLKMTADIIDIFDFMGSIHYFVSGKFRNKEGKVKHPQLGAKTAFTTAGAGGFVLWLHDLKAIDFGKHAARIANVCGRVFSGIAGIGFIFLGADAIKTLVKSKDTQERRQAWLDLAWSVAEIALRVLVVAAVSNVPGLVAVGIVASVLGLASFFYRTYNEHNQKYQKRAKEVVS